MHQSSVALSEAIEGLTTQINAADETVRGLQALIVMAPLTAKEQSKLSAARQSRDQLSMQRNDLQGALEAARAHEATNQGLAEREEVMDAQRQVDAVSELLRQAAEHEDKALAVLGDAVRRRLFWQRRLSASVTHASKYLTIRPDQQENMWHGLSMTLGPASGGIGEAIAFAIMNTYRDAELRGIVDIGPGVTFDPTASPTVQDAVIGNNAALRRRLGHALKSAGYDSPVLADDKTREIASHLIREHQ